MNNTAWQDARERAGLTPVRVHDLRHTYATRLRAAGVTDEDRAALLGHATPSMTSHYASGNISRLIGPANRALDRIGRCTILHMLNS